MAERKGNTVTIESKEGKKYKRNLTEVRKIIDFDEEEEEVIEDRLDTGEEREETNVQRESESDRETEIEKVNESERPKRNRRVSKRYGEYRVHKIS